MRAPWQPNDAVLESRAALGYRVHRWAETLLRRHVHLGRFDKQWMHDLGTIIYGGSLRRRQTDSSDGWEFPFANSPVPLQLREYGPAVVARTRRRRREANWPARPTGLGRRDTSRAQLIPPTSRCRLASALFTRAGSESYIDTAAVSSHKCDASSHTFRGSFTSRGWRRIPGLGDMALLRSMSSAHDGHQQAVCHR